MTDATPLANEQTKIEKLGELLQKASENLPKPVRMRIQSCLQGFDRAFILFDIDHEMASFRAITAEEEAAAALFRALQVRNYPGADRLDLKRHDHKAALWPVLDAARMAVGEGFRDIEFQLQVNPPEIRIALKLAKYVENLPQDMAEAHIQLVHPLDILRSVDGKPDDFGVQIQKIVDLHDEASIRAHVRNVANSRNKILYASDQSLPASKATMEGLSRRKSNSVIALCLCVGVLQTKRHQNYALQALECFLRILDRNEDVVMPYSEGVSEPISDNEISKN